MAALQCLSLNIHCTQFHAELPVFSKHNSKSKCYSYSQFSSKVARSVRLASNAPTAPVESEPPTIELEFLGPKPGPDGAIEVQKASVVSGEKLLRNIMSDNKIELYGTYGKLMNCGGGGSCGTCLVEIVQGEELLNERTATEQRYLKKKPETWRLACQTIVGDKENSGMIVQGEELLNERTATEQRYLKKKPETWRLACQTIVGDKENSGMVVVQRLPQWKKK